MYNISFKSISNNQEIESLTDRFQVLAMNPELDVVKTVNPSVNSNSNQSPSKDKMINDLIQLLKEGKISEETFKASMRTIENK